MIESWKIISFSVCCALEHKPLQKRISQRKALYRKESTVLLKDLSFVAVKYNKGTIVLKSPPVYKSLVVFIHKQA